MNRQQQMDGSREVYTVTFGELGEPQVKALLTSLSGTLHAGLSRLVAMPTIVFETVADDMGIFHRLRVPAADADYLVAHMESLIPGTRIEKAELPTVKWQVGVELHMKSPSRPLRVLDRNVLSHSILTSVQSLREGETVVIQWVIGNQSQYERPPQREQQPASHEFSVWRSLMGNTKASSDEIDDRRRKLEQPNVLAVGRVAVAAPHPLGAKKLARRVLKAFHTAGSASNWFTEHDISSGKLSMKIDLAMTPRMFGCQLNLDELIPLISWPVGTPYVAGLPSSRTRHMHVTNVVPREGEGVAVIGVSNATIGRTVGIQVGARTQHTHIIGPTRSGKSYLLADIAYQDMMENRGLILVETKNELFDLVVRRIPPHRLNDVIIWDFNDEEYPVGFNVMEQSNSRSVATDLNSLILAMYPQSGPMTTGPLYHGLRAISESQGTFIDLTTFLRPENDEELAWRDHLIANLQNRQVRRYWEHQFKKTGKGQVASGPSSSDPLLRRLWEFNSRDPIRNSIGQKHSSFLMKDVISEGKILLINADDAVIGEDAARLMCAMIVQIIWNNVRVVKPDPPIMLYLDEFQNFLKLPTNPSDMLAKSASYGLAMMLAHQNLDQIEDRELRAAVLANARSKIIFQLTGHDAGTFAREFGPSVRAEDFMNLEKRETISRIATDFGVSQPFTMRTRDIVRETSDPYHLMEQSRERYGRPLQQVEDEIEARLRPPQPTHQARRSRAGGYQSY